MKKTNPRKRPATGADVDKAWEKGVHAGIENAAAIMLTVLADHFGMGEQLPEVWKYVCKLSEEIGEGRISLGDLKHVLLDEYHIKV